MVHFVNTYTSNTITAWNVPENNTLYTIATHSVACDGFSKQFSGCWAIWGSVWRPQPLQKSQPFGGRWRLSVQWVHRKKTRWHVKWEVFAWKGVITVCYLTYQYYFLHIIVMSKIGFCCHWLQTNVKWKFAPNIDVKQTSMQCCMCTVGDCVQEHGWMSSSSYTNNS